MPASPPIYYGRSAFLHGFALKEHEVHPGQQQAGWWGSPTRQMPADVTETLVRLQAEDGAPLRGILYRRGGEKTALIFNHPQGDFSSHYLNPAMLEAGFAVFGGQTRNFANDTDCVHETLLADLAAQIRYLRAVGFEKVVLCGNSGGSSLSAFYQAQAETPPPGRLTHTPAGDSYDLNGLDMSPADGLVLFGAHVGEGIFALENLDPSVTDEADPLSCDPELDMYNPANGYRKAPEVSKYSDEFLSRYRAAQRARCERIDATAREIVERRRVNQQKMADPAYNQLPLEEQLQIARLATSSRYIWIPRIHANPGYTDLSIDPSNRVVGTILGPDPHLANYKLTAASHSLTPEAWLSTWSGLTSRAATVENLKYVTLPLLVVNYTADQAFFPHEAQSMFREAGSADKEMVEVDADHYGYSRGPDKEAPLAEIGEAIVKWLAARFPVAG